MIRRFIFIPVWLLTLCIKPFFTASHPWKRKKTTLQWWVDGGTENAYWMGVVFWQQSLFIIWLLWFHFSRV